MALPDIGQQEATLALAAEGAVMSRELNDIDNSLISIFDVLVDLTRVNERTANAIENMLNIEFERQREENLTEGLKLEEQREAEAEKRIGFSEKIDKQFEKLSNNTSFLGSMALFAGGALATFSEDVNKFLGKFGLASTDLDNIITGLAATRVAIPKTAPSKIPTPPAAKPAPKFGPLKSATATPAAAALKNTGLDKLKSSRITAAGKTIPKASADALKRGATATAKATDSVAGSVLKGTAKTVSKVATPIAVIVEGANVAKTELDDSLTRSEKNIKHSESAGSIGGALLGAKIGAQGYAAGPLVGTITTITGAVAGSLLGEELGEFLGKMGFGEVEKPETMADKLGNSQLRQTLSDEDRVMNAGPVKAASETQMYGMNIQGFNAAAKSKAAIAAESMRKIESVKPSVSGDNINVTVKVDQASKQTVDPARVTPIIRQGDTVNNITNINGGGSSAGRSVPSSAKQNKSSGTTGYTEIYDPVVDGP